MTPIRIMTVPSSGRAARVVIKDGHAADEDSPAVGPHVVGGHYMDDDTELTRREWAELSAHLTRGS